MTSPRSPKLDSRTARARLACEFAPNCDPLVDRGNRLVLFPDSRKRWGLDQRRLRPRGNNDFHHIIRALSSKLGGVPVRRLFTAGCRAWSGSGRRNGGISGRRGRFALSPIDPCAVDGQPFADVRARGRGFWYRGARQHANRCVRQPCA